MKTMFNSKDCESKVLEMFQNYPHLNQFALHEKKKITAKIVKRLKKARSEEEFNEVIMDELDKLRKMKMESQTRQ